MCCAWCRMIPVVLSGIVAYGGRMRLRTLCQSCIQVSWVVNLSRGEGGMGGGGGASISGESAYR